MCSKSLPPSQMLRPDRSARGRRIPPSPQITGRKFSDNKIVTSFFYCQRIIFHTFYAHNDIRSLIQAKRIRRKTGNARPPPVMGNDTLCRPMMHARFRSQPAALPGRSRKQGGACAATGSMT